MTIKTREEVKPQKKGSTFSRILDRQSTTIIQYRPQTFGSASMACHPFTRVTTRKDSIDIHHSTKYKVTDAGSQSHSKDQVSLKKVSGDSKGGSREDRHYKS